MGEIHNERDIEMAIGTVAELLREINEKAETDLWENAKIYRVDVTHDVITPLHHPRTILMKLSELLKNHY